MRALLYLLLCGCGPGGTAVMALSWQFADGRRCADSGAAAISVEVGSQKAMELDCDDGLVPGAVQLEVPKDGAELEVQARSTQAAALYSGSLSLDAIPLAATVTLYADKMR